MSRSGQSVSQSGMTIYVVRPLKGAPYNGKRPDYMFGNSLPCNHCQQFLAAYNVTRIKYTDIINNTTVLCELRLVD